MAKLQDIIQKTDQAINIGNLPIEKPEIISRANNSISNVNNKPDFLTSHNSLRSLNNFSNLEMQSRTNAQSSLILMKKRTIGESIGSKQTSRTIISINPKEQKDINQKRRKVVSH